MSKIRCSLSFHKLRLNEIPTFAGGVRDGVYGNPTPFTTPPMLQPDFQKLITDYQNTRDAYKQGGLAQKGPFLTAKELLIEGLDKMAEYVDSIAKGNANTVTLAGYVPTKSTTSDQPSPDDPTGILVSHGSKGVILAECEKQAQATGYGCIMTVGEPLPSNVVINGIGQLLISNSGNTGGADHTAVSNSDDMVKGTIDLNPNRKKRFLNLIPGLTYHFVFYAYNAQGVSGLSASASIMCV